MTNRRFEPFLKLVLDKKRFRVKNCPCGKNNNDGKFVPFVGYDDRGYCHSCGETFLPELAKNNETWKCATSKYPIKKKPVKMTPGSQITVTTFKESLGRFTENYFVKYLIRLFGPETTANLIGRYFIGTSNHWIGATLFWQIDIKGKIRTGKIMLYDGETGKRIKEPYNHTNWAHRVLNLPEFVLGQCFFGEHLLRGNNLPVAIVESEKTAIIASIYFPKLIWIAAGNKTGLTDEKCKVLRGRKVVLYPDLNAFELWTQKAKEFSHIACYSVSDLLDSKATEDEKKQGLDLADYLVKIDAKQFGKYEIKKNLEPGSILINNILSVPTETWTGPDFENMKIVWIRSQNGNYDVLFDAEGELVTEFTNAVNRLAVFFEKDFKPVLLQDQKVLAHFNKQII